MAAELLRQAEAAELLRFATAGSVDDGKSTLIGRLLHDSRALYEDQLAALDLASRRSGHDELDLALVTDGLRAEREQKITIDVAYRHFATPRRRFIIADTPGHEQYTRNMVTGASTADLAVVLVDVTGGLREQSRRHAYLSWLLGIRQLVVAVNKMDAVDYAEAEFRRVCDAFRAITAALPGAVVTFIPVSALRGDNVVQRGEWMPWYTGPALLEFLETVPLPLTADQPLRFPVQHVLRPSAEFRGYAGTIASGAVAVGDQVAALPGGVTTSVSAILGPAGELEAAAAPMAVTLRLADDLDLGRGHVLCDPDHRPWELTELEATLVWMDETPLDVHRTYLVKHTTNLVRGRCVEVTGRLDLDSLNTIPARGLSLNDIGRVRMKLLKPILADPYRDHRATGSFIVIDPDSHQTVAAGMVEERLEATGGKVSGNVTRHSGRVTAAQRAELLRQRPVTLWLTGLSGAGKSSVAYAVEERLIRSGHAAVVLDGDNLRHGLNRDLGFAPHDRSENIRRVAEVARLFNDAGLVVLTAFISPYAADREQARGIIGVERFVEVFVDAPLEVCEGRDPKGLYAKARAGQLPEFTGVSAPYEPPAAADVVLDTATWSIDEVVEQVWRALAERGVLADLEGES